MMRILLYCSRESGNDPEMLKRGFEREIHPHVIESCGNLAALSDKLRTIDDPYGIAILYVGGAEEMEGFINLREYLKRLDIVLIVSEHHTETIKKGRALFPRYVADAETSPRHLNTIINRIVQRSVDRTFD